MLLCTFHVTKCWLENARRKLVDKQRFKEAFAALHDIMLLDAGGSREERATAVEAEFDSFKQRFSGEPELLKYVKKEWEPKKGAHMRKLLERMRCHIAHVVARNSENQLETICTV